MGFEEEDIVAGLELSDFEIDCLRRMPPPDHKQLTVDEVLALMDEEEARNDESRP